MATKRAERLLMSGADAHTPENILKMFEAIKGRKATPEEIAEFERKTPAVGLTQFGGELLPQSFQALRGFVFNLEEDNRPLIVRLWVDLEIEPSLTLEDSKSLHEPWVIGDVADYRRKSAALSLGSDERFQLPGFFIGHTPPLRLDSRQNDNATGHLPWRSNCPQRGLSWA